MAAQIRVQTSRWSKIADSHLERTPLFSIKHLFLRKPSQEHQIQDSCRSCMKSSSGGIFHSRILACEIRVSFYARFPCDIYGHNVTFFVIAYLFPCPRSGSFAGLAGACYAPGNEKGMQGFTAW